MPNLLIAKRENGILVLKRETEWVFPKIKKVNDELKRLTPEYTLSDIATLIHLVKGNKSLHVVECFIKDKLLSQKDDSSFSMGGFNLDRNKIKELLCVENCNPLFEAVKDALNASGDSAIARLQNLYVIQDGEISIRTDIDSYIEGLFSYYTQNSKQDEALKAMNNFIEEFNVLCTKLPNSDKFRKEMIRTMTESYLFTYDYSTIQPSINYILETYSLK